MAIDRVQYEQNGFEIEKLVLRDREGIFLVGPRRVRYKGVPDDAVTVMTARRKEKRKFIYPQQRL